MAADLLEFLRERFIREFHEAKEEFDGQFPLYPEFQNMQKFLEETINPSSPIEMKNGLYDLIYELEECSMLAEKERHRNRQNQKGSFNVYTVKKRWFIHKTRNKLLQIKGNLEKYAPVESSSPSDSISTVCSQWNSSWLKHFPSEIYGVHHQELKKIKALLLQQADNDDGGIKTIGIVGMSGIGKTILARMVVNDQDCRKEFSSIIWVTLSQNSTPSEIMSQLLEKLSDNIDNDAQIINHDALPEEQLRELLSNKKYLLVLDNVLHPNEWYSDLGSKSNLQANDGTMCISRLCHGLPKGGGGAIIVTSRLEEVATSMVGDQNLFRLHPTIFNAEAVWSMFVDSIGRKEFLTSNQHQRLSKMKDEIIDKCDGLPLAAKTLAEIISTQMGKKEYDFWSILRLRKKFRLRLDQLDDISYNKAMEKVKTLQGVEDVSGSSDGEITIIGRCLPVEIARELGKLGHTELISVEQIQKIAQEVSFFHKKFVLKLDLHGDKDANKAMKIVSKISGTDSISMDMKEKKLTVVGDVDPVKLVRKMRKYWHTDIISIGPGPARQPPKKEKSGTKMLFSSIFRCSCINQIKE